MMLSAQGVSAGYAAGRDALVAATAEVRPGSILAVTGPNGSGKTTLLRVLLGLLRPSAGGVTLDGRPLGGWTRREVARRIGVVPQQEDHPFPLRVREAVMLGRYPHLGAVSRPGATDREAVDRAMEQADVHHLAARSTDTLSGGEWQRVRVARALAQAPAILVLDEPTASLDVRHEMEVFELVAQLAAGGLGALVVTHHLNLAARFADRMLLLDAGRPVARGTPREVLTEDTVTRVFRWPVAVTHWTDGAPQVVPLRPHESTPPIPDRTQVP